MKIFKAEISGRLIFLVLTLVFVSSAWYFIYLVGDAGFIHVKEHHLWDVRTPMGNMRKEIKIEKKFDAGEEMSEYYMNRYIPKNNF